jgi:Ca2+-binding EF-hand superfamily protein
LKEIFDDLDANKDGTVSRAEFIKAIRRGTSGVNEFFGLSTTVRQEDGTRDRFERVFQAIDTDNSRSISWEEFVETAALFHADSSDKPIEDGATAIDNGALAIDDGALAIEDGTKGQSKGPPQIPPLNIAKAQMFQGD